MRKNESADQPRNTRHLYLLTFLTTFICAASALSQSKIESPYYARVNTFGVFSAYSGDSSHILMGDAENRKLLDFGVSYSRKLVLGRIVNWQYNGELLPVALESDPVVHYVNNQTAPEVGTSFSTNIQVTACVPASGSYSNPGTIKGTPVTYTGTYSISCSRRWTIGEGISPVGFQWNFLPRNKMQPFFIGHGGYMYSTQPIPVSQAGSFNFTFDLGAGFELYRSKTRSVRAEYRIHHISNHGTATENPGIDNGLFQVTYAFGR